MLEETIQERLADELALGAATAVGLWHKGQLCGVAAWKLQDGPPPVCVCALVAVQEGFQRRGFGRRLKNEVVEQARAAGAVAVRSIVHWDNDPMIQLNVSLGASVETLRGGPDYCVCVIPLG